MLICKFSKYRYSLIDYTAVTKVDVGSEFIADFCIAASKVNPDPILAFAAEDDLIFGLSRMYESFVYQTDWVFRADLALNHVVKNQHFDISTAFQHLNRKVVRLLGVGFLPGLP